MRPESYSYRNPDLSSDRINVAFDELPSDKIEKEIENNLAQRRYALSARVIADELDGIIFRLQRHAGRNPLPSDTADETGNEVRLKKSTSPGEARAKLIGALTAHHGYGGVGQLKGDPIGVKALARLARVSAGSASAFYKQEFRGLDAYKRVCNDFRRLHSALKALNGEYSPHELFRRDPDDTDKD